MLLVQAGYPARAMQLLEPISSHRGLVTMAKIATCYAHQDNLASANVFLDQAEQESSRFLLTMPRELAIEMAHASAAVGNEPQAKEWKEKIFDPADLEVAQSLIEAEQLRRGALPMEKLGVKTEPALLQQIALQLGAKKGSQPQMAEWLKKTEGRVDLMYPVDRVEAYLQLAKVSAQLGLGEEAARLRQKAGAFSLQISPRTDSGTEGRVLVAEAYLLAGDRGEAEAWIAKARESLPENSYMAQPKTYSRVAEVVWQMGNAKEAEALWTEAHQSLMSGGFASGYDPTLQTINRRGCGQDFR
jgi:tetratricopeptide (TPR) repeat protein